MTFLYGITDLYDKKLSIMQKFGSVNYNIWSNDRENKRCILQNYTPKTGKRQRYQQDIPRLLWIIFGDNSIFFRYFCIKTFRPGGKRKRANLPNKLRKKVATFSGVVYNYVVKLRAKARYMEE
jgi:hypothetical protein